MRIETTTNGVVSQKVSSSTGLLTKKCYYEDTFLTTLTTELIEVGEDKTGVYFLSQETIFHPQGGGQPSDIGKVTIDGKDYAIGYVREAAGQIKHYFEGVAIGNRCWMNVKRKSLNMCINFEHRQHAARLHSAGHLLASLIEAKYLGLVGVKGNHFSGQAAVFFRKKDISTADEIARDDYEAFLKDGSAMQGYLEEAIKNAIALGGAITSRYEGPLRMVQMAGFAPCPCGGTHVKDIRTIGRVKVNGIKFKKKEGLKISYEVSR